MLYHEVSQLSPEAKWMVFIHGAGGSMVTWKFQVDAFKPYFNLLLLDLRDHGNSKDIQPAFNHYTLDILTDDIIRLMDHLDIKKAFLMSLSLGSIFVQHIAGRRPDLVDRTIMAGAVCKANLQMKILAFIGKKIYRFIPFKRTYELFSFIIMPGKNHRYSRKLFRTQARKIRPQDFNKWMGLLGDFLKSLDHTFKEQLLQPALLVMGREDHVFYSAALQYARHQQLATLLTMPDAGHVCNIERPKAFNRIVLDFLLQAENTAESAD